MNDCLKTFCALCDATRLRIYLLLAKGELCVCELTSILGMEQSRISHCLNVLKSAGLVDARREGKWIIHRESAQARRNAVLIALKKETGLSESDNKNLAKCRKDKVRERCCVKTKPGA